MSCYNCGEMGHLKKDCPRLRNDASTVCYVCGGTGHFAAVCPSKSTSTRSGYGKVERVRFDRRGIKYPGATSLAPPESATCYICGKPGHFARECRSKKTSESLEMPHRSESLYIFRNLLIEEIACLNCHQLGHIARNCPESVICRRCGQQGHVISECTQAVRCNNCLQTGHFAKECPNATVCYICKQPGHTRDDCPMKII